MLAQHADPQLTIHTTGSTSDSLPTLKLVTFVASTDASLDQRELASVNTPTQIEHTRIGLFDLRAELTKLPDFGLSNRRELRVTERSFFWATYTPLASAN